MAKGMKNTPEGVNKGGASAGQKPVNAGGPGKKGAKNPKGNKKTGR